MTRQTGKSISKYRYELVHGDDADFVAYQRNLGNGVWRTLATWMIPGPQCG